MTREGSKKQNEDSQKLDALKEEMSHFDFKRSLVEQQKEIKNMAKQLIQISKDLSLSKEDIAKLGGDAIAIAACAVDPKNPKFCIDAIRGLIDALKLALQKKKS